MDTGASIFLAAMMTVLVALNVYGGATLAALVDGHIKDLGIACIVLALVTLWNSQLVRRVAFYVALVGALYLLGEHWQEVANVF